MFSLRLLVFLLAIANCFMRMNGTEPSNLPLVLKKLILRKANEPGPTAAPEPESWYRAFIHAFILQL